jgi:hypothetical protein
MAKYGLILLLLTGCSNRAMYGYDRIISVDASEPGVQVYIRPTYKLPLTGYQKLKLIGTTPLKVPTWGTGMVEVWAVKGDQLVRTAMSWEAENQRINFEPTVKMTKDDRCCLDGTIYIGMHHSAARISWGEPRTINRTITAHGTHEQWCYNGGSYIYIDDDRVSAIQN